MSETRTDCPACQTEDEEERTCPVCGQPYVHSREVYDSRTMKPSLREDYTHCEGAKVGRKRTWYIHD